jgi:hypothetical protein
LTSIRITSYFHLPLATQYSHGSLAYIYATCPSNDVNVSLSSDCVIHAIRQEDIKAAGAIFKVANTRYTMVVCLRL